MSQPIDPRRPRRAILVVAAALALLFGWREAPTAAAPFGVPDETAEELLAELSERYEVITLSRGYVVRPAEPGAGFQLIEIGEEGVLVDGERTDLETLRLLLDSDAARLFALAGDAAALESLAASRRDLEAEQRDAAREIEENIRRQLEELERLDAQRLEEMKEAIERDRRRVPRRRVRSETRVAVGSSLTIEENETARDVVVILGPLNVRGEVRGDSVVVLSNAEISGRLEGELTVVGGNVSIGPNAVIDGNVNCVGGLIDQSPSAIVDGEITEISMAPFAIDVPGFEFEGLSPFDTWSFDRQGYEWFEFAATIFSSAFLAFLVLLTVTVARRRVDSVAARVRLEPWKSGLVGIVVEILVVPVLALVSVLLLVSIVGIPVLMVLLPLAALVLVLLFFLGYSGVAVALGRAIHGRRRFSPREWSPFLAVLVGLVLIQSWQIVGEGLAFAGGFIRFIGVLLILSGFFVKYLAWTVGLGAVMLDRFSPLPATGRYVPPPPPPLPDLEETPLPWEERAAATPPPPLPWEETAPDDDDDGEYREAGRSADASRSEADPAGDDGPELAADADSPPDSEYLKAGEKSTSGKGESAGA